MHKNRFIPNFYEKEDQEISRLDANLFPNPHLDISQFRINNSIRVPQVRLIDASGENVGVVSTEEASRIAREADLDLVEIAPNADPPVCRVMDFGKFVFLLKILRGYSDIVKQAKAHCPVF